MSLSGRAVRLASRSTAAHLACVAILVAIATGCTTEPAASVPPVASAAVAAPSASALPACAEAGATVSPQPDFPGMFPLPDGAVVVGADTPPGGGSRIQVLVPLEVDEYGAFLERALPAAGFSIGGGEAEADELESKFSGNGLAGQLSAREVSGCPGVLRVLVVIRTT